MTLDWRMDQTRLGTSTRLKFIVFSTGSVNDRKTEKIAIQNLAFVQFFFTNEGMDHYIQCQILVYKNLPNSDVRVKVSSEEFNYSVEKFYSVKEHRSDMGPKTYDYVFQGTHVYWFTVTISACKIETVNEKLYKDIDFTDFQLSTAEGSVAVHKAFLAVHSDVFKTMLSQEWKETAEGRLKIEGITLQTLQHLKQYMYLGTLPDGDGIMPLLSIARCYLIESLRADCVRKMSQNIKPEEYYSRLKYSMENKLRELTYDITLETPKRVIEEAKEIYLRKHENPEADSEAEAEAYAELYYAEPGAAAGVNAEVVNADAEANGNADAEVDAEADPNADADVDAEVEANVEADAEADPNANVIAEADENANDAEGVDPA